MLKETETEETRVFFVTFLLLLAFQLGGGPPGYAYALKGQNLFIVSQILPKIMLILTHCLRQIENRQPN